MRAAFIKIAKARRLDTSETDGHWNSTVTQLAWDFWVAAKITPREDFVLLPKKATREVLQSFYGPPHIRRELQVLANCDFITESNPLKEVTDAFNDQQKFLTLLEESYDKRASEVHQEEAGNNREEGRGTGSSSSEVSSGLRTSDDEVQPADRYPFHPF